jgi:type IV pilus assembly protein PilA
MASAAKASVAEYFANRGSWPANNSDAGIGVPGDINGKYVSAITINDGGITVDYGNEANVINLVPKTVGLTPGASTNGDVIWLCGYGTSAPGVDPAMPAATPGVTNVAPKYLPSVCR